MSELATPGLRPKAQGSVLTPAELQRYPVAASYWWMYLPGLVLVAVVLSYHQLADAVRERLGVVTV